MTRLFCLLVVFAVLAGCHKDRSPAPSPSSRIVTAPVKKAPGPLMRTLLGQVAYDPSASSQVMARLPALSVVSIRVFAGDHVARGETVMVLKSPDFLAAESELASVLDNPGKKNPNRGGGLRLLAEQKLRLLGASRKEIERLERTRKPVDRYEVRSPLSGTLIRIGPAEGAQVRLGDLLFEVSDLSRLWVQAFLYPGEEKGLRRGATVEVVALHEEKNSGTGRILRIAPFIDPATRTIPLRIAIDNARGLFRPDSWVRIRIPVENGSGTPLFLVPERAVVRMQDRKTAVFVVRGGRPPALLPVDVLGRRGPDVEVRGRFGPDDRVVTEGLLPLLSQPAS
ncbi:MAG: efflux RND transporter periplasmic adaptor subunit [Nitrospirae bacterium]|nr:efflux RND transporter periplasmic adaptor subunit [Nitrospirota bacterium]